MIAGSNYKQEVFSIPSADIGQEQGTQMRSSPKRKEKRNLNRIVSLCHICLNKWLGDGLEVLWTIPIMSYNLSF